MSRALAPGRRRSLGGGCGPDWQTSVNGPAKLGGCCGVAAASASTPDLRSASERVGLAILRSSGVAGAPKHRLGLHPLSSLLVAIANAGLAGANLRCPAASFLASAKCRWQARRAADVGENCRAIAASSVVPKVAATAPTPAPEALGFRWRPAWLIDAELVACAQYLKERARLRQARKRMISGGRWPGSWVEYGPGPVFAGGRRVR
jgi:hypothetical protein